MLHTSWHGIIAIANASGYNDERGIAKMAEDTVSAMTQKELLLEVWADMKIVKPAMLSLQEQCLPKRVSALETRHIQVDAAAKERGRLGSLSNKSLLVAVALSQLLMAVWVAIANGAH